MLITPLGLFDRESFINLDPVSISLIASYMKFKFQKRQIPISIENKRKKDKLTPGGCYVESTCDTDRSLLRDPGKLYDEIIKLNSMVKSTSSAIIEVREAIRVLENESKTNISLRDCLEGLNYEQKAIACKKINMLESMRLAVPYGMIRRLIIEGKLS